MATLSAGYRSVELSVTNSNGLTTRYQMALTVERVPPKVTIVTPLSALTVRMELRASFAAPLRTSSTET